MHFILMRMKEREEKKEDRKKEMGSVAKAASVCAI